MNTISSSQPDWLRSSTSHEFVTMIMPNEAHKFGALHYDNRKSLWVFSYRNRESREILMLPLPAEVVTSTKFLQGHVKKRSMQEYNQKQRAVVNIISPTDSESNFFQNESPTDSESNFFQNESPTDSESNFFQNESPTDSESIFFQNESPTDSESNFFQNDQDTIINVISPEKSVDEAKPCEKTISTYENECSALITQRSLKSIDHTEQKVEALKRAVAKKWLKSNIEDTTDTDTKIVENIRRFLNQPTIKGKVNQMTQHVKNGIWAAMSGENILPADLCRHMNYAKTGTNPAYKGLHHRLSGFTFNSIQKKTRVDSVKQEAAEVIYLYLHDTEDVVKPDTNCSVMYTCKNPFNGYEKEKHPKTYLRVQGDFNHTYQMFLDSTYYRNFVERYVFKFSVCVKVIIRYIKPFCDSLKGTKYQSIFHRGESTDHWKREISQSVVPMCWNPDPGILRGSH
jgi:hypothetical protein